MLRRVTLSLIFTTAVLNAGFSLGSEPPVDRPIDNVTLVDQHGKNWSLAEMADRKLIVVAFLGTECPLAKLYTQRLSKLAGQYADQNVGFVGIDSNAHDTLTELAAFIRSQSPAFPILKDNRQVVANKFGAQRTPQVFLLDQERRVRYQGRVDDQWGIGIQRDKPQHEDLRKAIDDLLAGRDVATPKTEATGCLIGRDHSPRGESSVTYAGQIAAIFNRNCVECHRPGEIGPFALTDYEQAAGWAETIDEAITAGRMPPWHADSKYGKFSGERRLGDDEKQLIHAWVKAGAPSGDLATVPALPPRAVEGWQLPREPDLVVEMSGRPYRVPAEGEVKYQYFRVDPKFTEDKWSGIL